MMNFGIKSTWKTKEQGSGQTARYGKVHCMARYTVPNHSGTQTKAKAFHSLFCPSLRRAEVHFELLHQVMRVAMNSKSSQAMTSYDQLLSKSSSLLLFMLRLKLFGRLRARHEFLPQIRDVQRRAIRTLAELNEIALIALVFPQENEGTIWNGQTFKTLNHKAPSHSTDFDPNVGP